MDPIEPNEHSVNWKEVIIYYVIAVAVSAPFRLGWLDLSESMPLPFGLSILYGVLSALGPAVGYFVILYLLKSRIERDVTLFGSSRIYSVLALAIIPVVLSIIGWDNTLGLETHWYGFLIGLTFAIYAIGEELGWRGYIDSFWLVGHGKLGTSYYHG